MSVSNRMEGKNQHPRLLSCLYMHAIVCTWCMSQNMLLHTHTDTCTPAHRVRENNESTYFRLHIIPLYLLGMDDGTR